MPAGQPETSVAKVQGHASIVAEARRHRLTGASAAHLADLYHSLPLLTDAPPSPAIASSIRRIAIAHSLSACDAAHLERVQRLGSRLATLDQDLARAAAKSGVPLFLAGTRGYVTLCSGHNKRSDERLPRFAAPLHA